MRPKFVLALVAFSMLVLAGAFCIKQATSQLQPSRPPKVTILPPPAVKPAPALAAASANLPASEPPPTVMPVAVVKPPMTSEEKQAYIEAETSRLQDLSTQDDAASLSAILNDVTNSEKAVRLAAIEATKQFGSKDAIPSLQADVAIAPDTDEKIALLEAADFLALPTLTDAGVQTPPTPDQLQAIQQQRQREAARKQFLMQKHSQNQNELPQPAQNSQSPQ
jgi:hypothetical protein